MQPLNPATVQTVGFGATGNILKLPGIHQTDLKPTFFQYLVERNPVFCSNSDFLERVRFLLTFFRELLRFFCVFFITIPPGSLVAFRENVGSEAHIPSKSVKEYIYSPYLGIRFALYGFVGKFCQELFSHHREKLRPYGS